VLRLQRQATVLTPVLARGLAPNRPMRKTLLRPVVSGMPPYGRAGLGTLSHTTVHTPYAMPVGSVARRAGDPRPACGIRLRCYPRCWQAGQGSSPHAKNAA
jgi:hypothetical protein